VNVIKNIPKRSSHFYVTDTEYNSIISGRTNEELIDSIKNNNVNEESVLIILRIFPQFIKYINEPTTEQQSIAVISDPEVIKVLKDPSLEIQKQAIKQNPRAIQYISKPNSIIKNYAIKLDPFVISYIKKTTISNWKIVFKSTEFKTYKEDFIQELLEDNFLENDIPFEILHFLKSTTINNYIKTEIMNHTNWKNDAELIIDTILKTKK
jgi:hypothetical protein